MQFHAVSKYKPYENEFDFKGITNIPRDIQEMYKFENKYNVKISFY